MPAKKELKKLDFGVSLLDSYHFGSDVDYIYLETELATK